MRTGEPSEKRSQTLIDAGPLQALLSLPAGGAPSSLRPLLCFLHGRDEAAPAELYSALSLHGPLNPAVPSEVAERFVIVAPQLPAAGDLWHLQADAVRDIVMRLQRDHGADPARCYLTGFSFGGNGVFDLALQQPGLWAALWAVDPTRLPAPELAEPAWLSIGDIARRRDREFIERLQSSAAGAVAQGRRLHLDQRQDHVGSARLAYADTRIYAWLLQHGLADRRPA